MEELVLDVVHGLNVETPDEGDCVIESFEPMMFSRMVWLACFCRDTRDTKESRRLTGDDEGMVKGG